QSNIYNENGQLTYDLMKDVMLTIDDPNIVLETLGRSQKKHGSQMRHFKAKELGSSEAEKDKVLPIDVKYFNDGLLKLIKDAKRHFLCPCGDKYFSNQSTHSVGFLVMGKEKITWQLKIS
ncbi:hypothetical protein INT47_002652, partial [Mucor saturninus]